MLKAMMVVVAIVLPLVATAFLTARFMVVWDYIHEAAPPASGDPAVADR